jgi:N-methylhydantoinase A
VDCVVWTDEGRAGTGKALSMPSDLVGSVLESIKLAAGEVGLTLEEAVRRARFIGHGTTVGVNAVLTGAGARVGVLTTKGFEATLPIARANYTRGLEEQYRTEALHWGKPSLLVDRSLIKGVDERIDSTGSVIIPLDENQARAAIRSLAHARVEALAIALLWSVANPVHEQRLAELVAEEIPDAYVSVSSDLSNRVGEYERSVTAVLNSYVGIVVSSYLESLEKAIHRLGFGGTFFVMQTGGGVQGVTALARRPIRTFNSGPVGGLTAALRVGSELSHRDIVCTDVGGTSFDVGLIVDGRMQHRRRPMIGRYDIAMPFVDIESIGTGGGSIAWVDLDLQALRVGPMSAGADPGPVCYRRGGARPTVTDAAAVLGYVGRMSGSLRLDRSAALSAVEREIAEPLGIDVYEAADGILRVANSQMADLVRRTTTLRGYDLSRFVLYAFGGAAPQYVGRYAEDLGVQEVIVPRFAAAFSAYGLISSDIRTWAEIEFDACDLLDSLDLLNERLSALAARAAKELRADRIDGAETVTIAHFAGMRFRRQIHELQIRLPDGPLNEQSVAEVLTRFAGEYERLAGKGTASAQMRAEVVSLAVELGYSLPHRSVANVNMSRRERVGRKVRRGWFDGEFRDCPVFDGEKMRADFSIQGPAFIDLPTTTLVVYPSQLAHADGSGNFVLKMTNGASLR